MILLSYLAWYFDAFGKGEEDNNPAQQQAQGQLPSNDSHVMNPFRYIQHVIAASDSIKK